MRAFELAARITPDGNIEVAKSARKLLPAGKAARVIVLVPDTDDAAEQSAWDRLATEQFFTGYAAADAVYDRPWRWLSTQPAMLYSWLFPSRTRLVQRDVPLSFWWIPATMTLWWLESPANPLLHCTTSRWMNGNAPG